MQHEALKATGKAAAAAAIEGRASPLVELDYKSGGADVLELGKLGRQRGVSVLYRTQEAIAVENLRALKRGLGLAKDTFRQRHLICMFDLAAVPADDATWIWERAAELGDVIVPGDMLPNLYAQWKN